MAYIISITSKVKGLLSNCDDTYAAPALLPGQPLFHTLRGDPGLASHWYPGHQVTSATGELLTRELLTRELLTRELLTIESCSLIKGDQVEHRGRAGHCRGFLAWLRLLCGGAAGHLLLLATLLAPDQVRLLSDILMTSS